MSSAPGITCKLSKYCVLLYALLLMAVQTYAQESAASGHSIHLISNQTKYIAGDTIFLKAYFVDPQMKGVVGKHVMGVHLIDQQGASVLRTQFNVLAGVGINQLILPDSLPPGFYNITAYMSPVEDRSNGYSTAKTIAVVTENQLGTNRPSTLAVNDPWVRARAQAIISPVSKTLARRQNTTAEIEVRDGEGRPVKGEFSVSIYNRAVFGNLEDDRPQPETHTRPIDLTDPSAVAAFNGFQKTGKVFDAVSGAVVVDNTQVLFYLQNTQWYHQTFTVNGSVRLNLPQFNGTDELFYLGETPRGKIINVRIEWMPTPLPAFHPAPSHTVTNAVDEYASFMKKARHIQRSYHAFAARDSVVTAEAEPFEFELAEPDNIYYPDRYVNFKSMAEMILEVIPGLYHRKHGASDMVRLNIADPITSTTNPIYVIDGKVTANNAYFLSLSPANVEYLALIKDPKKLLPLRVLGKNGIVIVKTKSGKFAPRNDDTSKIVEGVTPAIEFHHLNATSHPSVPIYRSTLYWNPSIRTDKDGKATITFGTTDDVGEMIIEVQGITSNGEPFRSSLPVHVR
ncbi:MAG TPA: hypothetical protein VGD40_06295 [Chryseosolibacter sp.]